MYYNIYLAGKATQDWRNQFVSSIDDNITVFNPMTELYSNFTEEEKADHIAKEIEYIENSDIIVFYLDETWESLYSMILLGDAVGSGKQVLVCLMGDTKSRVKIIRYCEYRGILLFHSMEELITASEECLAQIDICENDF